VRAGASQKKCPAATPSTGQDALAQGIPGRWSAGQGGASRGPGIERQEEASNRAGLYENYELTNYIKKKDADVTFLLWPVAMWAALSLAHVLGSSDCVDFGFSTSCEKSACAKLSQYVQDAELVSMCNQCCHDRVSVQYKGAVLEMCD
jgi:hypothetical protein